MRTVSKPAISANAVMAIGVPAVRAAYPVRPRPAFPPGVLHWHGKATGSWWAMVPGIGHLIEGVTEDALAARVRHVMYGPAL